jgi:hypothetical protein
VDVIRGSGDGVESIKIDLLGDGKGNTITSSADKLVGAERVVLTASS